MALRFMARENVKPDRRRAASRREDILDCALRLFSEHGLQSVTTRQIAAAVGISQPSLYAHFPTKHALAASVCERAFEALSARMAARGARMDGPEDLKAMARVYIDFGLTEPDAYKIAFMIDMPKEPELHALEAGHRAFSLHREAVAATLGQRLDAEAVEVLAQSLWASIHGLVSLLIARPGFPWVERERLIKTHLDRLALEISTTADQTEARA